MNALDNDCLLLILERAQRLISLSALVQMRLVCARWRSIIERICSWRTSLKLFGSHQDLSLYCRDLLHFNLHENQRLKLKPVDAGDDLRLTQCPSGLQHELADFIVRLFPNIDTLVIAFYSGPMIIPLADLLSAWPQLICLAMASVDTMPNGPTFQTLNSLHSLRSFYAFELFSMIIPGPLPVLSRLDTLLLKRNRGSRLLLLKVNNLCTRELCLKLRSITREQFEDFLARNPRLPSTLTHLTIGLIERVFLEAAIFTLIADSFPALVYLNIWSCNGFLLLDIVRQLHKLPDLQELRLSIGRLADTKNTDDFNFEFNGVNPHAMAFPNVHVLHINDYHNGLNDDHLLLLAGLFPALERLVIRASSDELQLAHFLERNASEIFPQLRRLLIYSKAYQLVNQEMVGGEGRDLEQVKLDIANYAANYERWEDDETPNVGIDWNIHRQLWQLPVDVRFVPQ